MSSAVAPQGSSALACHVITEMDAWRKLESVWDTLLHASPDHTPWQNFAFLTAWWANLGGTMPLRVLVVERSGVPCLIMPLQISQWNGIPGCPVRLLEPISMIMDVNRPRLAIGPFDAETYRCALDVIWHRKQEWDLIRIDEKPWDDAEVSLLREYALQRTCIFRQSFSHLVPYLDLRQTWTDYLKTKSQKLRKNLKAARKRLESLGRVDLRRYESGPDALKGFGIFLDLHSRSWKKQRKVEQSKSPAQHAFFERWVRAMADRGACGVLVLYCNDEPVAATTAFTDHDVYYSAQIVHDAKYAACSPGTLLESMELELLMSEQRFARYEFLGSFLNNKRRWSDTATNTAMVLVLQRSIRTFIMDAYYSTLKPYLRPVVVKVFQRIFEWKKNIASSSRTTG
jgi:CelD/BcsL family acetyltransferase involved in cellulose biosynthesis